MLIPTQATSRLAPAQAHECSRLFDGMPTVKRGQPGAGACERRAPRGFMTKVCEGSGEFERSCRDAADGRGNCLCPALAAVLSDELARVFRHVEQIGVYHPDVG